MTTKNNWEGKKGLMIGAGRQGQALVQFMVRHGAEMTLSDSLPFDKLSAAYANLSHLPIHWITGGHPLSLLEDIDFVCVTGGADLQQPILREALERGLPVLNDTMVFLMEVNAPVIGITGSSGKTTTTTLVGLIAKEAARQDQKVWVGGNIGNPLLTIVEDIQPQDIVILELSSFQLELATISPKIAAILNITPNHLDRHGTMQAYINAKRDILKFQQPDGVLILNRDDPTSWPLRTEAKGSLISFGFNKPAEDADLTAIYMANNEIKRICDGVSEDIIVMDHIQLRGRHNIYNVMAACAIATAAGFSIDAMRAAISSFSGVPHRLQFVRQFKGARWYNDSIATAPERTLAAVRSFEEPLILLLGGRDKKLPWDELAVAIHQHGYAAVLFGEAAPLIRKALEVNKPENSKLEIIQVETLQEAVQAAAENAHPGDVVLLSPGGTSYDAFNDFEQRGKAFTEWVMQLV
jgi:UDP-N-acetylmuramoylalanine--D-glutamate ligase